MLSPSMPGDACARRTLPENTPTAPAVANTQNARNQQCRNVRFKNGLALQGLPRQDAEEAHIARRCHKRHTDILSIFPRPTPA